MIAKLYDYFGVIGILSIVLWVAAIVFLLVYVRRKRHRLCLAALGIALAAVALAKVNSSKVSAIMLDRREETAAALKESREQMEAASKTGTVASVLQFAEGDPEDAALAYRKQGKQARTAGKRVALAAGQLEEPVPAPTERLMPEADLRRANQLDRVNLLIVQLVLWAALGVVVADYLARLNSSARTRWPLPLACRWLDRLCRKTRSLLVLPGADACMAPPRYLERAIRKGENVLYFGDRDPADFPVFARLGLRRWTLWPLPKLVYGAAGAPRGSEFALDAAWFGRYGVLVLAAPEADALLADIAGLLRERHETGASARVTLHIIWDLSRLPDRAMLASLIRAAGDLNVKLAVWAHAPVAGEFAALFEERIDGPVIH